MFCPFPPIIWIFTEGEVDGIEFLNLFYFNFVVVFHLNCLILLNSHEAVIKQSGSHQTVVRQLLSKQSSDSHQGVIRQCSVQTINHPPIVLRICAIIFLADLPTWGVSLGPKLPPGHGFFGPWPFLILKSSHQDLSNGGQTLFWVH